MVYGKSLCIPSSLSTIWPAPQAHHFSGEKYPNSPYFREIIQLIITQAFPNQAVRPTAKRPYCGYLIHNTTAFKKMQQKFSPPGTVNPPIWKEKVSIGLWNGGYIRLF